METIINKIKNFTKCNNRCNCNNPSIAKFVTHCPAHDDSSPSLSVKERLGRKPLLHCFAGCNYEDIYNAFDLLGVYDDYPIN